MSIRSFFRPSAAQLTEARLQHYRDDEFIFPVGSLIPGADNIITIVQVSAYQFLVFPLGDVIWQDNMGLNQTDGSESASIFLTLSEHEERHDRRF